MSRIFLIFSYALRDASRSRVILALIIISLSISSAAVLMTTAVLDGFQATLTEGAIGADGHIVITPKDGLNNLPDPNHLIAELQQIDNIEAMSLRSYIVSAIKTNGKLINPYASVGINEKFEPAVSKIPQRVIEGRFVTPSHSREVVLGISLADALVELDGDKKRAQAGDEVEVNFFNGTKEKFIVAGILDAKTFYPNWEIYFNKAELEAIDATKKDSELAIKLKDVTKLEQTRAEIANKFPDLSVTTWKQKASYIEDINTAVGFITKTIGNLLIMAVFVIISIVIFISVSQKKRQIGIMKSMGTSNKFIVSIFLIQTVLYSILSFTIGFLLFMIIHLYSEAHPVSLLIGDFHTTVNRQSIAQSLLILFTATIAGSLLPGIIASRTKIADIIADRN